ncbi:Ras- protein Rab-10 [Desmophyllum pertusum]|uniref:Ras-related protein Rab-13 n=1 Tax=Desmophyllum pertusum TaxID=174260 RepID=A0A9W9YFZ5_9CNID|nr:Ras- protein Rab-10 [Desmophyllum pertusum]
MAYKKISNQETYDYMFKVLLLGDAGVGKTSLMWRFSDDVFNQTYISTIGIDLKLRTIDVEGKKVRLQVWDTAGQERFHAISVSYYRTAVGIMLVYDITRRRSFENIAKWLRNIDEHAQEDVVKLLIGNKCDMQQPRDVKREEGEMLADEYDMSFFETSAKENESIDEAFECIAREIMERFVLGWAIKERDKPTQEAVVEIKRKSRFSRTKECC